jgi:hypothetical protein
MLTSFTTLTILTSHPLLSTLPPLPLLTHRRIHIEANKDLKRYKFHPVSQRL